MHRTLPLMRAAGPKAFRSHNREVIADLSHNRSMVIR